MQFQISLLEGFVQRIVRIQQQKLLQNPSITGFGLFCGPRNLHMQMPLLLRRRLSTPH